MKTNGGNIVVAVETPQTITNGSVFKTFTVSTPVSVITASGYFINSVTRNGATVTYKHVKPLDRSEALYPVEGSFTDVLGRT